VNILRTKKDNGMEYTAGERQRRGCIIPQTVTHTV